MTDRATLGALLARVQEGSGEDRALNADIAVMVGGWQRKWHDSERPHGWYWRRGDYSWTAEGEGYPSDYLGSLDAVLRDLLLKGWDWRRRSNLTMALVYGESEKYDLVSVHHEPCRALIAACLKARMEALGE